jgi:very-short-patch-repair endonuclease
MGRDNRIIHGSGRLVEGHPHFMKLKQAKELIADITKRGWVKVGDKYLPPSQAKDVKKAKSKKPKAKVTGWIDDDRNIRNKQNNKEPFIRLVEQELGLIVWPEFYFSTERKYRIDYAIPIDKNGKEIKVAVEVDGGIWSRGKSGHSSGVGIKRDQQKTSLLAANGWRLLRFEPTEILTIGTIDLIKKAIEHGS